jgi:glycerol kinase
MALQTRDVVDAMVAASGTPIIDLRVDGGASAMDLLCQIQADQLGVSVQRPIDRETTALGAAFLAGLAEGVWPDIAAIDERWECDASFSPEPDRTVSDLVHTQWLRAVERSRNWER